MKHYTNILRRGVIILVAIPIILVFILFLMSCFRHNIMIVNDFSIGKSAMLVHGDTVIPNQKYPENKTKGRFFKYYYQEKVDTIFISEETSVVGSHIVDHNRNKQYLVIDQKPLDSVFGRYVKFEENLGYVGREKFPLDKKQQKEMLDNSNTHVYYIINQQTSDVYGPLTFDQYLTKKEELGVPEDLKLKCER